MTKFFNKLFPLYLLLPTAVVLFWVFVPFVRNLFVSNTELLDNRPLNEKPTEFTRNFAKEFEAYYNDTFAGRKKIISKYVKLQRSLNIDTGQYFYGQDGWMFYDSIKANNGNTLVDYYAEVYFDDDDLAKMVEGINMAYDFYAKRGIKYVIFVAPNKENIYSEFMPERMQRIRKSDISRMDKAVEYLKKHVKAEIVNAKPVILAAKEKVEQNLYFKKDTHWNNIGAYIGFSSLAQVLNQWGAGINLPSLTALNVNSGELRDMDMEAGTKEWTYEVAYRPNLSSNCTQLPQNERVSVCKTSGTGNSQKLLVWTDSFASALMPYFNRSYKTVFYSVAGLKKLSEIEAIVDETKPNIVVDELVERYFDRLLKYNELYGE